MDIFGSARVYADMVKLWHTLFALPFALSAICLAAANGYSVGVWVFFWILVAFTAARSTAMGFNRIVDADIDALNPRTKDRPTVTGAISRSNAKFFTIVSAFTFLLSSAMLNWICLALAPPALLVLLGYSYIKRVSAASHYVLGFVLALAPVGAWIAVADSFDPRILVLGAALLFHISGFDLIYALQDIEFDRKNNLYSIPAVFGRKSTLMLAALSFAVATLLLITTGIVFRLSTPYWCCVAITGIAYVAGEIIFIKFGEAKTQLVFFYENASISGLILLGCAVNLVCK